MSFNDWPSLIEKEHSAIKFAFLNTVGRGIGIGYSSPLLALPAMVFDKYSDRILFFVYLKLILIHTLKY
jgi:hypothetical protein